MFVLKINLSWKILFKIIILIPLFLKFYILSCFWVFMRLFSSHFSHIVHHRLTPPCTDLEKRKKWIVFFFLLLLQIKPRLSSSSKSSFFSFWHIYAKIYVGHILTQFTHFNSKLDYLSFSLFIYFIFFNINVVVMIITIHKLSSTKWPYPCCRHIIN